MPFVSVFKKYSSSFISQWKSTICCFRTSAQFKERPRSLDKAKNCDLQSDFAFITS